MTKYHMNKQEREIKDPSELRRLMREGKYAVIAMCRENEPYIVTLSYGYDEEKKVLYFHSALKGLKLDFIKVNPAVCATIIEDRGYLKDQCSHAYSSIVINGKMSVIEEFEEKKHAMEVLLSHLEENPDPIRERNFKSDKMYNVVTMMKLDISDMTGKSGG